MNLRQIRYCVALCEDLNFTRAAKRCHISQPSLTNAIKSLENEFNGLLFYRSPTTLTPLGQKVRPHLQRALAGIENATRVAAWHVPIGIGCAGGFDLGTPAGASGNTNASATS